MNPELIKRLKNMQQEMEKKQNELNDKEFVVEKQGITISAKGDMSIQKITIDEALVDPDDIELLEDLIVVSFNELIDNIKEAQNEIAPKDMPGGFPF
ncbi:YbaB/EbfC family nucleoid-associated protein [Mycoplasmopsis felis]|uniref:YbaB/EbfC family nucleoid-associated protein n=1 Tax=Mycoplasmopsis felis TaxID=33923 RepID=UPI00055D6FFF|nr:YbaB/EbfC family nucleoid-associated protein [Mycoplasmopsis felis]WQQ02722.1 YbaB/EbfC family nucleoid-associated protein [Mycoplasmopsis felis]WQQ03041.1 YbaB/EbfC family nucleoid-associated protein [Mycoplasmopsis felis]WQQ05415.1 YbaB/EbfC family nucleoid-associated protein [Mycoplasmopsis felis]WQQ06399.1 YbaB/EbfC family nucleoid-associated protein [Mycoplasmopsis felis]WQQ08680.1 YbaB/EbfC family nucleoid-associated protein [Mycoplasmopsis felis]